MLPTASIRKPLREHLPPGRALAVDPAGPEAIFKAIRSFENLRTPDGHGVRLMGLLAHTVRSESARNLGTEQLRCFQLNFGDAKPSGGDITHSRSDRGFQGCCMPVEVDRNSAIT